MHQQSSSLDSDIVQKQLLAMNTFDHGIFHLKNHTVVQINPKEYDLDKFHVQMYVDFYFSLYMNCANQTINIISEAA